MKQSLDPPLPTVKTPSSAVDIMIIELFTRLRNHLQLLPAANAGSDQYIIKKNMCNMCFYGHNSLAQCNKKQQQTGGVRHDLVSDCEKPVWLGHVRQAIDV